MQTEYLNDDGKYSKFADGEERTLTYHGWVEKDQRAETPEKFRSANGKEYEFNYTWTKDGVDLPWAFSNKTFSNAFIIGQKEAGVVAGDVFIAKRTGMEMSTRYAITKLGADKGVVTTDAPPF